MSTLKSSVYQLVCLSLLSACRGAPQEGVSQSVSLLAQSSEVAKNPLDSPSSDGGGSNSENSTAPPSSVPESAPPGDTSVLTEAPPEDASTEVPPESVEGVPPGGENEDETPPGQSAPPDEPPADVPAEVIYPVLTGPQVVSKYVGALCRLYTESPCVAAQGSCGATLKFESPAECDVFFRERVSSCEGLVDGLVQSQQHLYECVAHLQAYSCQSGGFCVGADRVDSRGPCAPVAALIAGCDQGMDTGLR